MKGQHRALLLSAYFVLLHLAILYVFIKIVDHRFVAVSLEKDAENCMLKRKLAFDCIRKNISADPNFDVNSQFNLYKRIFDEYTYLHQTPSPSNERIIIYYLPEKSELFENSLKTRYDEILQRMDFVNPAQQKPIVVIKDIVYRNGARDTVETIIVDPTQPRIFQEYMKIAKGNCNSCTMPTNKYYGRYFLGEYMPFDNTNLENNVGSNTYGGLIDPPINFDEEGLNETNPRMMNSTVSQNGTILEETVDPIDPTAQRMEYGELPLDEAADSGTNFEADPVFTHHIMEHELPLTEAAIDSNSNVDGDVIFEEEFVVEEVDPNDNPLDESALGGNVKDSNTSSIEGILVETNDQNQLTYYRVGLPGLVVNGDEVMDSETRGKEGILEENVDLSNSTEQSVKDE